MSTQATPKRHPGNSNLTLWCQPDYYGLPLMVEKGPFITEYLEKFQLVTEKALMAYPRVFAARVDLKLPSGYRMPDDFVHNTVIRRFIDSFGAQLKADQDRAAREERRVHATELRYFWVREVSGQGQPHYHFAFMLNRDAYHTLGRLETERVNMFHRLQEAWARALQLSILDVSGLVNVPDNASFHLNRGEGDPGLAAFFHRVSYFCKNATKEYFGRTRNCGYSRI
ncbi:inovirus Gp2 family protein [Pseudomonas sp. BN411]|uniref:inovirus Gp2 family protein n=1 Tax=Pseudomonas sp. BN411 TaxID=2567887 RepID=UPI002457DF92|nr:inovirus Gp2 family protein [Pseudomonas sp. BN411]MDH4562325.1 inovirus Gp2 family protein [Pseudomonas sp. BN411]